MFNTLNQSPSGPQISLLGLPQTRAKTRKEITKTPLAPLEASGCIAKLSKGQNRIEDVQCRICKDKQARYSCPSCNLPYCSLECFRNPGHSSCSESFYQKVIKDQIRLDPDRSNAEKQEMMDILKRIEAGGLGEHEPQDDTFDLCDDEPAKELEGRTVDDLLAMLTLDEKNQFEKLLRASQSHMSGSERPEDRQELNRLLDEELNSLGRHSKQQEITASFWWEELRQGSLKVADYSAMIVSGKSLPMVRSGPDLRFNITAIVLAYVYTMRTFPWLSHGKTSGLMEELSMATDLITSLVPYLVRKGDRTLFTNTSDALDYVFNRVSPKLPGTARIALLQDLTTVLRPRPLTELGGSENPSDGILIVLSHLHKMFSHMKEPNICKPAQMKLLHHLSLVKSEESWFSPGPLNHLVIDIERLEQVNIEPSSGSPNLSNLPPATTQQASKIQILD